MKFLKFFIIIFISLTLPIKADLNEKLMRQLEDGGKLIFIRHAYAPGNGDPNNFNLNDCSTQRNLSNKGREQAEYIGEFFKKNEIKIDNLNKTIVNCKKCPRLVKFIKKVSTEKRKQNINEIYWGKPVPGFGNLDSKLAIIGLAPAAHGGTRLSLIHI